MAKSENLIQKEIKSALCKDKTRVFRNNVGMINGIQFGLCKGSADLIGWKTVTITEDMIGKEIAQFVSVEVKTPNGRVGKYQNLWLEAVQKAGGLAIIARSKEQAVSDLEQFRAI